MPNCNCDKCGESVDERSMKMLTIEVLDDNPRTETFFICQSCYNDYSEDVLESYFEMEME
jgi:hypothetical protein